MPKRSEAPDEDALIGEEGVHLVAVHHVRPGDLGHQAGGDGTESFRPQVPQGLVDPHGERRDAALGGPAERDQAGLGQGRHRPGQLERVALAAAE